MIEKRMTISKKIRKADATPFSDRNMASMIMRKSTITRESLKTRTRRNIRITRNPVPESAKLSEALSEFIHFEIMLTASARDIVTTTTSR